MISCTTAEMAAEEEEQAAEEEALDEDVVKILVHKNPRLASRVCYLHK